MSGARVVGELFATVPAGLHRDPRLTANSIAVYSALALHVTFGEEGGAYPGHARLAELAHVSVATVKRELARLADHGWVSWESGARAGTTNTYRVSRQASGSQGATGSSQGATGVAQKERGGRSQRARGVAHTERQPRTSITENQEPPLAPAARAAAPEKPKPWTTRAIDCWNGRYGKGSASSEQIAGNLGILARAGHDHETILAHWERFVASEKSTYGPAYFRSHFADFAERPTEGRPAEIPPADLGRARSCGAVVESAFRDRGIDRQSSTWWQRIVADAKRLNRHPSVLAFEQLHTLPSLTTSNGNGTHA